MLLYCYDVDREVSVLAQQVGAKFVPLPFPLPGEWLLVLVRHPMHQGLRAQLLNPYLLEMLMFDLSPCPSAASLAFLAGQGQGSKVVARPSPGVLLAGGLGVLCRCFREVGGRRSSKRRRTRWPGGGRKGSRRNRRRWPNEAGTAAFDLLPPGLASRFSRQSEKYKTIIRICAYPGPCAVLRETTQGPYEAHLLDRKEGNRFHPTVI